MIPSITTMLYGKLIAKGRIRWYYLADCPTLTAEKQNPCNVPDNPLRIVTVVLDRCSGMKYFVSYDLCVSVLCRTYFVSLYIFYYLVNWER